jgi:NitT/TauT family transport system substrate-binding protein
VLTVAVGLALVATACGDDEGSSDGGGSADAVDIRVAAIPPFTAFTWPLVVAESEGYFEEEGIGIEETFTFDGAALLAGGQIDVLYEGADSGLLAAEQGQDVIAFGPLVGHVTDGLLVSEDITEIEALPGEALRVSGANATDEFVLERYLEENGVDPESIDYLPVEDDGAALAQLEAGQIAGGMFDQGVLQQAENGDIEGAAPLVRPIDFGPYPWGALQTTRTWAEEHPEAATGFVRAIQRAMEFIRDPANQATVVQAVLAADESLDQEGVELTYEASGEFTFYETEPLTPEDIEPAVEYLREAQGEDITVDLERWIDNSYVDQAQAAG